MTDYDPQKDKDINTLCNDALEAHGEAFLLDIKCLALRKAGDDLAALCADAVEGVILCGSQREALKEALEQWEKESDRTS